MARDLNETLIVRYAGDPVVALLGNRYYPTVTPWRTSWPRAAEKETSYGYL